MKTISALLLTAFSVFAQGANDRLPGDVNYLPNDSTGTTLNYAVGISAGKAIALPCNATSGPWGVAVAYAGTTGNVAYVTRGVWQMVFENTATVDHWVVPCTGSTAGQARDSGSTSRPSSGLVMGKVLAAGTATGQYWVVLSGTDSLGTAGGTAVKLTGLTVGTGGVTAGHLVKYDTNGTIIAVTGTESILGIAQQTASAAALADVVVTGASNCVAEGSITAGHYLIAGSTDPTACKDSGQTSLALISTASRIAGRAAASASTGASFAVDVIGAYRFGAQVQAADIPVIPLTAGTSASPTGANNYVVCTSTCTITVPVPAAGSQLCVRNGMNVSTVITLSAIGSSAMYEKTDSTAYGTAGTGTMVSAGAVGDKVCIVGLDSTHYLTMTSAGTWTVN